MTDLLQHNLITQLALDKEIEALKEENRELCSKLNDANNRLRRTRNIADSVPNMERFYADYRVDNHTHMEDRPPMDFIKRELALELANTIVEQAPIQVRPQRHCVEYAVDLYISFCALGDEHARQRTETRHFQIQHSL